MNTRETAVPARVKGPMVWLDMDQKELDDAYDQTIYAPNMAVVNARYAFNSDRARARLAAPERHAYGPSDFEQLDLFRAEAPHAPINIFIHGGGWLYRSVKQYAFMAETYVRAGAHFAGLDFTGVDKTGGDLRPIVEQIRCGILWVYRNAARLGGNPDRIYISAHSSGAHLSGVMCVTDWTALGAPKDVIKGALLSSGIYDLKPVRLSKRYAYISFDDEIEEGLSSQRHLDRLECPLVVSYGTCEPPEFQRQSRDLAATAEVTGKQVKLVVCEGYNHFEMLEMLGSPYSLIGHAALELMGLAR